nr:ras-related protein Rab-43 isoform X1 [Camelus dromedarius]
MLKIVENSLCMFLDRSSSGLRVSNFQRHKKTYSKKNKEQLPFWSPCKKRQSVRLLLICPGRAAVAGTEESQLQIWDTAGQERFRTITQSYYRSANGAILAYDITKKSSFLSVPHWIEDVRKYAGSNIVQLLIGNKSDLSELREVPLAEAQSLAEHYDILCAIETSAKDSSNVEEAFVRVATELVMRHGGPLLSEKGTDHIQLDSKDVGESWGCGC